MQKAILLVVGKVNSEQDFSYSRVLQNGLLKYVKVRLMHSVTSPVFVSAADVVEKFAKDKKDLILLEIKKSLIFWRSLLPNSNELVADEVGYLVQSYEGIPSQVFAYKRTISEGEIWIILPYVRIEIQGGDFEFVHLPSKFIPDKFDDSLMVAASNVNGYVLGNGLSLMSEIIKNIMETKEPWADLKLSSGEEIFDKLFSKVSQIKSKGLQLPQANCIENLVRQNNTSLNVHDLAAQAKGVWCELLFARQESLVSNKNRLNSRSESIFIAYLKRQLKNGGVNGLSLAALNNKVIEDLFECCSYPQAKNVKIRSGLRFFPSFLAGAAVETICHIVLLCDELLKLLHSAKENFEASKAAFIERLYATQNRFERFCAISKDAMYAMEIEVEARKRKIIGPLSDAGLDGSDLFSWNWYISDEGIYPPPIKELCNLKIGSACLGVGWCSIISYGHTLEQMKRVRIDLISIFASELEMAFGMTNKKAQAELLECWKDISFQIEQCIIWISESSESNVIHDAKFDI